MKGRDEFEERRKPYFAEALGRSREDDAGHAIKMMKLTLGRYDNKKEEKELRQQRFLKRWTLLLACGLIKIDGEDPDYYKMPTAQIMGSGARAVIVVKEGDNRIAHWLLSKDATLEEVPENYKNKPVYDNSNISQTSDKTGDQIVHTRGGGSHGFEGDIEIKVSKSEAVNPDGRHLGVDVAIGGVGQKDIHNREIEMDGLSGHAYIYIDPTNHNMLLGMETCSDPKPFETGFTEGQFGTHTPACGAEIITALGTAPFGKEEYQAWGLPSKRYDCLKINFKEEEKEFLVEWIVSLNPDDFSNDIVEAIPCSNMAEIENFKAIYFVQNKSEKKNTPLDKPQPNIENPTGGGLFASCLGDRGGQCNIS